MKSWRDGFSRPLRSSQNLRQSSEEDPNVQNRGAGRSLIRATCERYSLSFLPNAKVRRVRFHDLRHTFATMLIQQGEGLAYVRDQMGHSSIKVTVDIYGHLVPGRNRQAVDKLDEQITPKTAQEAANA